MQYIKHWKMACELSETLVETFEFFCETFKCNASPPPSKWLDLFQKNHDFASDFLLLLTRGPGPRFFLGIETDSSRIISFDTDIILHYFLRKGSKAGGGS